MGRWNQNTVSLGLGSLDLVLLHLLLHNGCSVFSGDLLQLVIHLEHTLVEDGLVNVAQEGFVLDHSLREFNIAHCCTREVLSYVINLDKGHARDLVLGTGLCQ
jgi:hypothetical protein